jgi:hypothetical protein
MAKILKLGTVDAAIEPDLKEFIDMCIVPILVRNVVKEIQDAEKRGDLEWPALPHLRCANGGTR